MNRRWFARKNIILRGEGVQVEVASPPQFTRNGAQVAVIGDIPPLPTIINELVTFGINAGNILAGAFSDLIFSGAQTPPATDGIAVFGGTKQIVIQKKGTYIIKVQLNVNTNCDIFCQFQVDLVQQDAWQQHVSIGVPGVEAPFNAVFLFVNPTDQLHNFNFVLRGETTPVAGGVMTYDNAGEVMVHHCNSF